MKNEECRVDERARARLRESLPAGSSGDPPRRSNAAFSGEPATRASDDMRLEYRPRVGGDQRPAGAFPNSGSSCAGVGGGVSSETTIRLPIEISAAG